MQLLDREMVEHEHRCGDEDERSRWRPMRTSSIGPKRTSGEAIVAIGDKLQVTKGKISPDPPHASNAAMRR
jgi:hypothetical protein